MAYGSHCMPEVAEEPMSQDQSAPSLASIAVHLPCSLMAMPSALNANSKVRSAMNGEVVLGLLPPASFASGHVFFVQHLTEWQEVDTGSIYAVHANHFIGRNTKRHLLREKGLWQVGCCEPSLTDTTS